MGVRLVALQERAEELGFGSIEEALNNGYEVEYRANGDHTLVKVDEQELAHREWLKEKAHTLEALDLVANVLTEINEGLASTGDIDLAEAWRLEELAREVRDAITFIERGEV